MEPRIYTYKITFEEVPYWYWGVHKEKEFGEEYWGSPTTNAWAWDLYTPKKQILELFSYNEEGWKQALSVEDRLILPDLNNLLCLNERCNVKSSLKSARKGFEKAFELGVGIFGRSAEEMSDHGRIGGNKTLVLGVGVHGLDPREKQENGKKGGEKARDLGLGMFTRNPDTISRDSRKGGKEGGKKCRDSGKGFFSRTEDEKKEDLIKAGKTTSSQKWEDPYHPELGIKNPGTLASMQKARGFPHGPENRRRVP